MGRVSLAAFDAKAVAPRRKEAIPKRPDGTPIAVWDYFTLWKDSVTSKLVTVVNEHDVTLKDHKQDLDVHSAKLANHETRLDALEARPEDPFPVG
jgi:hypothetical protein